MERLTTDTPNGNFETMLNFVHGKDGWAHIYDEDGKEVNLIVWALNHCHDRGCDDFQCKTLEEYDEAISSCMVDYMDCPIAMAYCFASQAVHLRSRLKMYEDAMPLERVQELSQTEKDGRLVAYMPGDKVYDRFGTPWIVESSEIHLIGAEIKHLYRCGHPGTEDYYAMYEEEILTREEAEAALKKRKEIPTSSAQI